MERRKKRRVSGKHIVLGCFAAALMLAGNAALAQSARIATGGGALNMRKEALDEDTFKAFADSFRWHRLLYALP